MKFIFLEQELSKNTIFIYFRQVFQSYGNINIIIDHFWPGSYQIWPCHLTQAKNV